MPEKFSIRKRLISFRYAFAGLWLLIKEEHNARVHLAAASLAIVLGCWLGLSMLEWAMVAACIGGVLALEAANSAIEALADFVCAERHEQIKKVKDLAAGAVLLGAMAAAAVGGFIFLPKLWALLH